MELLCQILAERVVDGVQEVVEGNEMVRRFDDVVNGHGFLVLETDGAGFKDIACLFLCELAALYAIRVVCKMHLGFVIQASFAVRLLFVNKESGEFVRHFSLVATGVIQNTKIQIFGEKVKKKAGKSFHSAYGCLRVI